ncbi:restriction endonuclease subunit S [Staphylococcus haemolyticus]|uniref:restriction endonuclease subunit S n=1 Tax=Staphylococcus haemolyticus TaxID=1283 RepID=UPI00069EAE76|nr:restriction endonuclease subunit S [Staphylococcus haemolyticus]MCH4443988.1 restriction endonuclease subunit S [Staphylococcus haemolyticus]
MTNEEKNVPELRFPDFEGEWEILKLGDHAIIKGRLGWKGLKQEEYVSNGHAFLIANKHINNGKVNWKKADQITQFRYEESLEIALQKGDLIFSKDGALGNPAIINELPKCATINSTMMLVRPFKEKLSSLFFYQILLSSYFNKLIHLKVSGSSIPHLFQADMKEFYFYTPKLEEQNKIGDFFSKLDRQIELEEKKLELLEQQKRGYMQKLFSQEFRFKDKHGNEYPNWQTVKIGSILKERRERSGDGEMLSVTINHGIVKFDEIERKDNSSKDKSNYKQVYKNDIAYNSMRMWQGASGKSEFNGIVSPAYTVVTPIENINSSFIAYYFKTHNMIHKFRINSQGLTSDTWNLKYKQLKDIKISICSKEEQDKIANLLTILDIRIKKQNHKLEILNINKKGLLQKMFV